MLDMPTWKFHHEVLSDQRGGVMTTIHSRTDLVGSYPL